MSTNWADAGNQKKRPADSDQLPVNDGAGKHITVNDGRRTFGTFAVASMADLLNEDTSRFKSGDRITVESFYSGVPCEASDVFWNPSMDRSNHDGISVIDPTHSVTAGDGPNGWYSSENSGSGCFVRKIDGYINVKVIGSTADGVTDDWYAIQAAIDYLSSNGGGKVECPFDSDGYFTSKFIHVKENVQFNGNDSVFKTDDVNGDYGHYDSLFMLGNVHPNDGGDGTTKENVSIEKVKAKWNFTGTVGTDDLADISFYDDGLSRLVDAYKLKNGHIEKCHVEGSVNWGIGLHYCEDVTVEKNYINICRYHGIGATTAAGNKNCTVKFNYIHNCGHLAIDGHTEDGFTQKVIGNISVGCDRFIKSQLGSLEVGANTFIRRDSSTKSTIGQFTNENNIFYDNKFLNVSGGFLFNGVTSLEFNDNIVKGGMEYDYLFLFYGDNKDVEINDNTFDYSGYELALALIKMDENSTSFTSIDNFSFKDNTVRTKYANTSNVYAGMFRGANITDVFIEQNKIYLTTDYDPDGSNFHWGLYFFGGSNINLKDNNIVCTGFHSTREAIKVDSGVSGLATRNDTNHIFEFGSSSLTHYENFADGGLAASTEVLGNGSWTPSFNGTQSYSLQSGTYRKDGRFVSARFVLETDAAGSGSSFLRISGLPFKIRSSNKEDVQLLLDRVKNIVNITDYEVGKVYAERYGDNTIQIEVEDDTVISGNTTNGSILWGVINYYTDE